MKKKVLAYLIKMAWFFPLLMSSEYAACAIAKTCGPPFAKFVLYACIVLVSYDVTMWKGFKASRIFLMYVCTSQRKKERKEKKRKRKDHKIGPRGGNNQAQTRSHQKVRHER